MQEVTSARLEAARKELLDLGLRNPLLNYRQSTGRGLAIVDERSEMIFQLLTEEQKNMSFGSRAVKKDEEGVEELLFPELSQEQLEDHYSDNKLQTNESDTSLQYKLLNTFYTARTFIEEQGVNALFLALGMLEWYETENSKEKRLAPLILVPVELQRSSARDRFSVSYSGNEILANISLEAKLKTDFDITLPAFPEPDDFSVVKYFEDITEAISRFPAWRVLADNIQLGFFSFGKFMIYHDLDVNKWPAEKKPTDHPILTQLFGDGFSNVPLNYDDNSFIDKDTPANQLFQVVDADSSQVLSMLAVRQGRDLVIQGPPGTGKSQTITNLIADAIGNNKKVLFVAEKMAALDVVKRRLDSINLGEACLELHSHKSNKKILHDELKRILELGRPTITGLQQEIALFDSCRDELNEYCTAVNSLVEASGLSAHSIIGYLLKIRDQASGFELPEIAISNIENWDDQRLIRAEAFCDRIQARLVDTGMPSSLPFWGSRLMVLMPKDEERLKNILNSLIENCRLLQSLASEAATLLAIAVPTTQPDLQKVCSTLLIASNSRNLEGLAIGNETWKSRYNDLIDMLNNYASFWSLRTKLDIVMVADAWKEPVLEIRTNLVAYGDKWYRFIKGEFKKSVKRLKGMIKINLPATNAERIELIDTMLEAQRLSTDITEKQSRYSLLFGDRLYPTADIEELKNCADYLKDVHNQIENGSIYKELLQLLPTKFHLKSAFELYNSIGKSTSNFNTLLTQLYELLDIQAWDGSMHLEQQLEKFNIWANSIPAIHKTIAWNNLTEAAMEEGFTYLINQSVHWKEASLYLKAALRKTYFEYLLTYAVNKYPALRRFERSTHEEVIQRFREMDRMMQRYNRAKVALVHYESIPRTDAGGQVNTLKAEFNKRRGHKPIRKLMMEAGLAIQAIKPVFMMSPLSIANFIPPGSVEFDLVIFDEASQVKPVDALGAILRAKQVVVVGDSKQLPPTSFFDSMSKETEDEDNVTADMQSVLGLFNSKGTAERMLRWHYRSKHESLITLSNHAFYENKLVIFPSPGSRNRLGLVYHHLVNTSYDRGKTRTNPLEAEAVADAVINHAQNHPRQSLGVVAFSTSQKEAIINALELKRRRHPELENFFNGHSNEPFFIKNLENVQGDERDVIFISIGYGRTSEGFVAMAFGPLTNDGGERRLNVLITRAKMRCEIFTNLTSDDIDTSRTKSIGIKTLKEFLYFAQHGKLRMIEESELGPQSPFEEVVASKLASLGYIVRTQVGSHGFYLDMAIVDAQNPGRYILGIECDGAAYHTARSARDRDRLRQQVLEGIGWKIHRIWSTDWFRNSELELKRVVEAIEKAKATLEVDDAEYDEQIQNEEAAQALLRDTVKEERVIPQYYINATIDESLVGIELHLQPLGRLAHWMEQVVRIESPVHFDEVARRITEAAGIARIGGRIRETLLTATSYAVTEKKIIQKNDFLWSPNIQSVIPRDRSLLPPGSRKIEFIADEEIWEAIKMTVVDAIAIQPEAAIPLVARAFGWMRVTEELRKAIQAHIVNAVTASVIVQDKEWLKPNKN